MKYHRFVEAFKYDGDLKGSDGEYYVPQWAVEAFENDVMYYGEHGGVPGELFLKTLSGCVLHVAAGDYIVKDVPGLHSCKPDKFDELYSRDGSPLRPCLVNNKPHMFHMWQVRQWVVEPTVDTPAGQCQVTMAIVEDEYGQVREVYPREVRFTDGSQEL